MSFGSRRSPASAPWLEESSRLLPTLLAVAVFVGWADSEGGVVPTTWYPGALFLLALLTVTLAAAPSRLRELSLPTCVGLVALAAYTAWSYLSLIWADAKGVAWDGANRTLLYLVVFALFAISASRAERAAVTLGAWTLGIVGLAVVVLVRLPHGVGAGPAVSGAGLENPLGYTNAEAALWLMAAWPALLLAARPEVPPWLRGIFAGGVVVLVDTAILSESRGSLIAAVIVLVAFFLVVPGRVRSLLVLAPVAVACGASAPHVLHVANRLGGRPVAQTGLDGVAAPILLAALAVALAVGAAALIERRRAPSEATVRVVRRVVGTAGVAVAVLAVVAGLVAAGNPVSRVKSEWREFKASTAQRSPGGGRLSASIGGARYDYYRVALDVWLDHPVLGVGADNFAEYYLARGRDLEAPTSPHSTELGALLETGLIGAALLAVALGGGLLAARRALRVSPPLARAVAGGAAFVFVYWLVQGSADWFWEFPALAAPAFAMLGLAGALVPRAPKAPQAPARAPARTIRQIGLVIAGVAFLAAGASLALPWLADREIDRASHVWRLDPAAAFRQLDLAADLDPLSGQPGLTAGTIAERLGMLDRADRAFAQALARDPLNAYATLELGMIAAHHGRRRQAERLLRSAAMLDRQNPVALQALRKVQAGQQPNITQLNQELEQAGV